MADNVAKIVLTAEDKTAAAMTSLRNGLAGIESKAVSLRSVFGALLPAASMVGATAWFKQINDGVDALNDLKDASGSSIENISALEDVAARTGTSFDTVGSALIKFNQALNAATPDSDAALALKAIGLEAKELKKLDPAEALRRTAVALGGFADDGNKARLAQELFGKSLREVAPLLKDLAESGELVSKVTTQQAEEAEKFNKQLFELQKNATDVGRSITSVLVPALNQVFSDMRSFGSKSALAGAASEVVSLKKELDALQQQRDSPVFPTLGQHLVPIIDNRIQDVTRRLEEAKKKFRELDAQFTGFGKTAPPAIESGAMGPSKSKINFDPDAFKKAKKLTEDTNKAILESEGKMLLAQEEEMQKQDDALRQMRQAARKERQDAVKEERRQLFETIDQKQTDAITAGQTSNVKKLNDAARELGMTFSSAFEDAVVGGKSFSDVLHGIEQDILRIMLRKSVTEPLAAKISGIDFGSLFSGFGGGVEGSAKGDAFTGAGKVRAFANGGIVNSPTLFKFANGTGLMGEAGPEAIMPLERGANGRLGVRAMGGGGGIYITNAPVINVDSRTDRREVFEGVDRMLRNNNAALVDQLKRTRQI